MRISINKSKHLFSINHRWLTVILLLILSLSSGYSQSSNILQSLVAQISGTNSIQNDYNNGKKWVAYFVAKPLKTGVASGGLKVLVDLDDVAGITPEGRDGWITVWVDVVASIGAGGWPLGFGVQLRSFGANAPDSPAALFDLTTNASVNNMPVDIFRVNSFGETRDFELKLGVASPLSLSEEFSVHGLSFEVRRNIIDDALHSPLTPGIAIGDYVVRSILGLTAPGQTEIFRNPLVNFRFTTPQDDPNTSLIQDIYSERLVQGIEGNIHVLAKVKESNYYYVRVWDGGGILQPGWDWFSKSSEFVYLNADQEYDFQFYVTPDSRLKDFSFWLYEKDISVLGFDTYKILEKMRTDIYSDPVGTDITPPTVALTSPVINTVIKDSVKAVVNVSDAGSGISRVDFFLGNTILGSVNQSPFEFWIKAVNFIPSSYKLTARAYDKAGNGAEDYVMVSTTNSAISLNNGIVYPSKGKPSDIFKFSTIYYNGANVSTDSVRAIIDSKSYIMTPVGTQWSTGVEFDYSSAPNKFSLGSHKYYFKGYKGGTPFRYPAADSLIFEVVPSIISPVKILPVDTICGLSIEIPFRINAGNINDLFSFAADLHYDPTRFTFVRAVEGNIISGNNSVQTSFMVLNNSVTGNVIIGLARLDSAIKISQPSSGNLLTVFLRPLITGQASVNLANVGMMNSKGNSIDLSLTGSTLKIVDIITPVETSLVSTSSSYGVGKTFDVLLNVGSVRGLNGIATDVRYNPAVVELTDVIEGNTLSGGVAGSTSFLNQISNTEGRAILGISRMVLGSTGVNVNRTGTIATLRFKTKSNGNANFGFENTSLMHADGVSKLVPSLSAPVVTIFSDIGKPHLFLSPDSLKILANTLSTFTFSIDSVNNAFSVAGDFLYKPDMIRFISVTEGNFLNQDGVSTSSPFVSIDSINGKASFGLTRLGAANGNVSTIAQKTIIKINVKILKAGTSSLTSSNIQILDNLGNTTGPLTNVSSIITGCSLLTSIGAITGNTSVCKGTTNLTYSVPVISGANSYIWTLPTGSTGVSTTNSISVSYGIAAISGNIKVKGHNDCGDGSESTLAIIVGDIPSPAGILTGSTSVCKNSSNIIYTVPVIAGATSYIWTLPTGATGASTTNSISISYGTTAASGDIKVKGHNDCGDGLEGTLAIIVNDVPSSAGTITGSTNVCKGPLNLTYSVSAITGATSYVWTLPSGATGTSATNSISISYGTTAASGDIKVKGHNDCGDGLESTLAITVSDIPSAAGIITGNINACKSTSNIIYSVPVIAGATSYIWTLPTGATGTSATNSISISYGTTASAGDIKVKGHNDCGDGLESTLAITVGDLPSTAGTISGSSTVSIGDLNLVYTVSSITGATSYIWTLPTGATGVSTTNSISVSYGNTATSGNIKVKGHSNCGDGLESTLGITVIGVPIPAGTITGIASVCKGIMNVTYSVPVITGATSYIWTLPTGATGASTTNSISVSFGNSAVSGSIKVKGHSDSGDGSESTLAITVNNIPSAAGSITGNSSVCAGSSDVSYSVPLVAGATSYIWTLPNGATGVSSINSIKLKYGNTATSGKIKVKGHNDCGDGLESSLAVIVNEIPSTPVISLIGGNLLSNTLTGNQWYFNNDVMPNASNVTLSPVQEGNYFVTVSLNSCTSQSSNVINYKPVGINDEYFSSGISLYPNPATSIIMVSVKITFDSDFTIQIVDNSGNLMRIIQKEKTEKVFGIDLSTLSSGIYILKFSSGKIHCQKKIIKR